MSPMERSSEVKTESNFGISVNFRGKELLNDFYEHPFNAFVTNLKEINVGYSIKKLNKEEIIQFMDSFFSKIGYFFLELMIYYN